MYRRTGDGIAAIGLGPLRRQGVTSVTYCGKGRYAPIVPDVDGPVMLDNVSCIMQTWPCPIAGDGLSEPDRNFTLQEENCVND